MLSLKYISFVAIVMAVSATLTIKIDTKAVATINSLVKRSNNFIVLVVDGKIQLVALEINASVQLNAYRNVLKNKNLVLIKTTYRPRFAKNVIRSLTNIIQKHPTCLVYFRVCNRKPIKGSVTTEVTRPVGLLGNLLAGLGISEDDEGLVPAILSELGIKTTVKDVNRIKFQD